jgi:hypothetical protein
MQLVNASHQYHILKTYLKHLNEKTSNRIGCSVADAEHCFQPRHRSGVGQSKRFARERSGSGARGCPKSGDGHLT